MDPAVGGPAAAGSPEALCLATLTRDETWGIAEGRTAPRASEGAASGRSQG